MNVFGKIKKQGCVSKESEDWFLMYDIYLLVVVDFILKERREL